MNVDNALMIVVRNSLLYKRLEPPEVLFRRPFLVVIFFEVRLTCRLNYKSFTCSSNRKLPSWQALS